jgi:hypothetical protein
MGGRVDREHEHDVGAVGPAHHEFDIAHDRVRGAGLRRAQRGEEEQGEEHCDGEPPHHGPLR